MGGDTMDFWVIVGRLTLAFVLGGLVGWEREREDKPAGLRTLILVSIGSALYVLVTQVVVASTANADRIDLLRIVAGVAQGVGFLGAGTIFTSRGTVHGLTTAAAIWAMSAVGVACGFGVWRIALVGTVLTFVALRLLGPLAMRIGNRWDRLRTPGECNEDG
jgi:putative Mg2+ transporter-C (MgtC) family protein